MKYTIILDFDIFSPFFDLIKKYFAVKNLNYLQQKNNSKHYFREKKNFFKVAVNFYSKYFVKSNNIFLLHDVFLMGCCTIRLKKILTY